MRHCGSFYTNLQKKIFTLMPNRIPLTFSVQSNKVGGVLIKIGAEIIPCEPEPDHTGVGKPRSAVGTNSVSYTVPPPSIES